MKRILCLLLVSVMIAATACSVQPVPQTVTTHQTRLLGFTEEQELTSPFAPGHVRQIREIWDTLLQN